MQTNRFVYPLAYSVCTPDCYQGRVPRPAPAVRRATTSWPTSTRTGSEPDPARARRVRGQPDEPYSIVRFVSWQAVHDRQRARAVGQAEAAPGRGAAAARAGADLLRGPAHPRPGRPGRPRAGGADPPPDRPRPAGRGRVGHDVVRGGRARGSRGVHRDHRPRATPTTRSGGTGWSGTSPRTSTTWRCPPSRRYSPRPRSSWQAARQRLLDEKIDVTAWMVDYFETTFRSAMTSAKTV